MASSSSYLASCLPFPAFDPSLRSLITSLDLCSRSDRRSTDSLPIPDNENLPDPLVPDDRSCTRVHPPWRPRFRVTAQVRPFWANGLPEERIDLHCGAMMGLGINANPEAAPCHYGCSIYLAEQCWNGGCIYLTMLRRIKRKAPLPPCNSGRGVGGEDAVASAGGNRGDVPSEPVGGAELNGKRTRKFGVISRPSLKHDSEESTNQESEINHGSSLDPGPASRAGTPTKEGSVRMSLGEGPVTAPPRAAQVLYRGSSATLPSHSRHRLSDTCKTESLDCEISSQVRLSLPFAAHKHQL
ncbi:hypothetical protein Z043_118451 [Scleropages formosus]|uniref:Uncharacterized protein n=1 Tax=Scleropages formosus TaxID=113540 RepID=A0A0P7WI28_SCLFO|nr:hypothetical protein Z043_118451 [Scleropages formosus]